MEPDCFVIMPIENSAVEFLWKDAFIPICEKVGFSPKRVDQAEDGTPMYQQIVNFINNSPLIIADLTLARPNCYFEVGYAFALEKYNNLILTCRRDHCSDSDKYIPGENKVHFDLQNFEITWWEEGKLDQFIGKVCTKIEKRRERITKPIPVPQEGETKRGKFKPVNQKKVSTINDLVKKAEKELRQWKKPS